MTRGTVPTTRAEARAHAYAEIARSYGMTAEVRIEDSPAEYYRDGAIMIPASRFAWVTITDGDLGVYGDRWHVGWVTRLEAGPGQRRTTRYLSGEKHVFCEGDEKFRTERAFASSLHVYSFRAAKEN